MGGAARITDAAVGADQQGELRIREHRFNELGAQAVESRAYARGAAPSKISGTSYFASVLADMHAEPRWRPEWLFSNFLIADCFGRARNAVALLGEDRTPESWTTRLDAAHAW